MATVGGAAYAGTENNGGGGQLWKLDDSGWNRVPTTGIPYNSVVFPAALGDQLEVCTTMFSTDGTPVGPARVYLQNPNGSFSLWIDQFADPTNMLILAAEFNGQYVAGVGNLDGFQVWSKQITHSITVTQGANGTITPAGTAGKVTVNDGTNQAFTIKPATGYHTAGIKVDGSSVGVLTSYTFTNVTANHTITATFAQDQQPSDSSIWYLAEGSTAWGFSDYISIENPNARAVHATITYMTGSGNVSGGTIALPASSQTTVNPADKLGNKDFSTKITCTEGETIAVDRTMSWTGPGAASPEGHSSVGVTSPAKTWYLPEGSSAWGFECWLLIQNPNASPATCTVTYMVEGASPVVKTHSIPASSRQSFSMADDIGNKDASIKVASTLPVIPERSMYRNNRREGHDSIGTTNPATDYYLAEGATGYNVGYVTYVLVQNPQDSPNNVSITYMTGSGQGAGPSFTMAANSRKTVKVNDVLPPNTDVSTHVHGSAPLIAERSMYWGAGTPLGEACHDSIGMDAPHTTFYLPDGQTSEGRETWTLVQNPNSSPVTVQVS